MSSFFPFVPLYCKLQFYFHPRIILIFLLHVWAPIFTFSFFYRLQRSDLSIFSACYFSFSGFRSSVFSKFLVFSRYYPFFPSSFLSSSLVLFIYRTFCVLLLGVPLLCYFLHDAYLLNSLCVLHTVGVIRRLSRNCVPSRGCLGYRYLVISLSGEAHFWCPYSRPLFSFFPFFLLCNYFVAC